MTHHVAVWIDQKEAKIFQVEAEGFEVSKVKAPLRHLTRKADEQGRHQNGPFFREVATALRDVGSVLVVGPTSAKLDFLRYAREHEPALEHRIVGIETLDHPTDRQLVAYVHHYFRDKREH